MATKAGVWIDHQGAVVVLSKAAGQEIKKIKSVTETAGGSKQKYTPNDFVAEDSRDRKLAGVRKQFYDAVLASVRGADSLLILGPGEAKGELGKHIQGKKLRGLKVELETTDRMTDRQIAAKVAQHFAGTRDTKSETPKKKAATVSRTRKKKTAK